MWISSRMRPAPPTADADLGVTTIAGKEAGVLTRGEVRNLPVYSPGGYAWAPENGAEVLVIKGGPGGAEQCVVGTRQERAEEERAAGGDLRPGEVRITGPGGSAIHLKADGSVDIRGFLTINGIAYAPCTCGEGI